MRHTLIISSAIALALASSVGFAQDAAPAQASSSMSTMSHTNGRMATKQTGDAMFVKEASAGGAAEVALGQLGQNQGSSDAVKQFGAQMVKDHTAANQELASIAQTKGLAVNSEPSAKDQAMAKKIEAMKGADFDKAFSKKMLADHKKTIALFKKESMEGTDPDLKAFATKTLPTLEQHLQMAQSLPTGSASGK